MENNIEIYKKDLEKEQAELEAIVETINSFEEKKGEI